MSGITGGDKIKQRIIPRSEYEVYFMPKGAGKERFLREHHPFYSSSCKVECAHCRIAGGQFEMLTVFRKARGFFPYLRGITQTAVMVASRLADTACVIKLPGEVLFFDSKPRSIPVHADDAAIRADQRFASLREIEAFAKKERIPLGSLRFRRMLSLCFAIPVCALPFFFAMPDGGGTPGPAPSAAEPAAPAMAPVPPTIGAAPISFAECFGDDVRAVFASGGTIRSYRHTGGSVIFTAIEVAGGSPGTLAETLEAIPGISGIAIPAVSFENGKPRYSVEYRRDGNSPNSAPPYACGFSFMKDFDRRCRSAGFFPERIQNLPHTEFTFRIPAAGLHAFMSFVGACCADSGVGVRDFSIDGDTVRFNLHERAEKNETGIPGKPVMLEVFSGKELAETAPARKKTTGIVVGRISVEGIAPTLFSKDLTGKMIREGGVK